MILAVDTATQWTGIALHDGTTVIAELGWRSVNTQTIELAPTVKQFLGKADATPGDLVAIAVAVGPGSYTGLRVGLGFAKGMALAYQLPLIGVPTLDIVATSFGRNDGNLIIVAEAGRQRVCANTYRWGRLGWQAANEPDIVSWPDLLAQVADLDDVTFAGEISVDARKLIRNTSRRYRIVSAAAGARRAGYLAEIGWRRLRRNALDDAAELAPIYLRDPAGQKITTP